jgi:hypothetical protein
MKWAEESRYLTIGEATWKIEGDGEGEEEEERTEEVFILPNGWPSDGSEDRAVKVGQW